MHLNIYAADLKGRQLYRTKKESDGASGDPEGGQGVLAPPEKSQVIWVSIGIKQLDPPPPPPPPWKKLDPPPGKCWTPSGTLKNDRFL